MPTTIEPLAYVGTFIAVMVLGWRMYNGLSNKHSKDIICILNEYKDITKRLTILETKQDIYLHEIGFDVFDVNRTIQIHMKELEQNDRLSIGCINIESIKRRKVEKS